MAYDDPAATADSAHNIIQQKSKFTELLSDACHSKRKEGVYVQMVEHCDTKRLTLKRA